MSQVLQNNQIAFRGCILYEALLKTPVFEAYRSICKAMENNEIDYIDFEYWYYRIYNGKLDLDYDRSLDPKPMAFTQLPIEIVVKIMGKLDSLSRLNVRKVSHNLRVITDSAKVECNLISIEIQEDLILLKFGEHLISYKKNDDGCMVTHENRNKNIEKGDFLEIAFNDLAIELKNPNLRVKQIDVIHSEKAIHIVIKWLKHIESLSKNINSRLHVEKLEMTVGYTYEVDWFIPLLKAGKLDQISLYSPMWPVMLERDLEELFKSEQWKQAKSVKLTRFGVINSSVLNNFFHFTHFEASFETISTEDIIRLRDALSKSVNFQFCKLKTDRELFSPEDLGKALGAFVPNGSILHRHPIPDCKEFLEFSIDRRFVIIKRTL